MGSKKKRKSAAPEELPATSSQPRRRSGGGGGAAAPLTWSADGATVALGHGQVLLLVGRASLTVQAGEVATFGAALHPGSGTVDVCADERCGGPLLLEPGAQVASVPLVASSAAVFTLMRARDGAPARTPLAEQQQQQQQQQQRADNAGEASCGSELGFGAWLAGAAGAPAPPAPLPPLWQQAVLELEDSMAAGVAAGAGPPLVAVCGAKKVGKSTFARLLLNSLLRRHPCIAFLDSDCGQPEFTAPGLVSLSLVTAPVLGPPHLHPRRPAAARFVGDVSPAADPARYLRCVGELYSWYCHHGAGAAAEAADAAASQAGAADQRQQQQRHAAAGTLPPLVVNTHGWVRGMGFDVLVELLQSLPVSHFVRIAAANPGKDLPPGAFWLPEPPQQAAEPAHWLLPGLGGDHVQPAASDTSARSGVALGGAGASEALAAGGLRGRLNAVEQRGLQWETLAEQCVAQCGTSASVGGDLGDRLASAVPFEVDADSLEVQVLHSSVPRSQLFFALNGAVVGLCSAPHQQREEQPSAGRSPPPLPCLGLGIVRVADAQRRRLHVLTAVPEAELEGVAVLQLGRLELPASLLQTGVHLSPYLCLHSLSSTGTGAGSIKSRNNLLRQGQV